MYGRGVYFARDASYSANGYAKVDAVGLQRMFLTRVLLGHSAVGSSSMLAPPMRLPTVPFDSLVDNLANPSIVVSGHNDNQVYPEYMVTFQRRPVTATSAGTSAGAAFSFGVLSAAAGAAAIPSSASSGSTGFFFGGQPSHAGAMPMPPVAPAIPTPPPTLPQPNICYNCGKPGHKAASCSAALPQSAKGGKGGKAAGVPGSLGAAVPPHGKGFAAGGKGIGKGKGGGCHKCGQQGHAWKQCPF